MKEEGCERGACQENKYDPLWYPQREQPEEEGIYNADVIYCGLVKIQISTTVSSAYKVSPHVWNDLVKSADIVNLWEEEL